MLPIAGGRLALIFGACVALGFSAYAVDDTSALLQGKVDIPTQDQDDLDLEAAEAEISNSERRSEKMMQEALETQAKIEAEIPVTDTEGAVDAELEAMEAEAAQEEPEEGAADADDEAAEEQPAEAEEYDAEKAKQALKERIAERARLAQASNYTFGIGSTVFVGGKKAKVMWDGRPDHEFVKVNWLEGKDVGKQSGVIPVEDCWLEAQKVVEIGSGRHLKKRVTTAAQQKKKAPKVKDTSRRRRSVLRRIVYGVKKLPMVVSIPFKGLKTGVDTITGEMTAHTGISFNGSLVDLLNFATGGPVNDDPTKEVQVPRKPRRNITEIVRNKTVAAVMKMQKQHLEPLMKSFTSELRLPELGGINMSAIDPQLRGDIGAGAPVV